MGYDPQYRITIAHSRIGTKGSDGKPNGFLVPIWNEHEPWEALSPKQVYLTVVAPHTHKGPHLHYKRNGAFTCIKGNVLVVQQRGLGKIVYVETWTGEDHLYQTIFVPAGIAAAMYNLGDEDAYVLNMPCRGYCAEDKDECVPEKWDYAPSF